MDLLAVITLSVSFILIMDPFASLPMFISVTKDSDPKTVRSYANKAVMVAALLLFVFILIGGPLMSVFGITMESFRIAGGLVLIMMAIEMVFGLKLSQGKGESDAPWVIIATPVMTGPGIITAAILFCAQYGYLEVIIASAIALLVNWALLMCSSVIMKIVGEKALSITSRIVGLLIAALGVEYIFRGATDWIMLYGPDIVTVATMFI